ncbi:hypothetical protein [Pantoea vagans]|uniref:DUF1496 domain-containing protein n=1 Tax=Pantoea vagans TaxID=470934 RepID=A0AAN1TXX4_9GAMM|nr:hypothetical protein [Pantoea vagans]AVV39996.1 hypothetical protein C9381_22450 [Pantoea vagans]
MKRLFRRGVVFALTAGLCASAFASQPVSDANVSRKLDQLNITAQVIDSHLQQVLEKLNQSAGTGTCWLEGKAYSQGAEAMVGGSESYCSVQPKTGWPQWESMAALSRPFRR